MDEAICKNACGVRASGEVPGPNVPVIADTVWQTEAHSGASRHATSHAKRRVTMNQENALRLAIATLPLICMIPGAAAAQTSLKLNLQVRDVDATDSCNSTNYRPEFKITNFGTEPVS